MKARGPWLKINDFKMAAGEHEATPRVFVSAGLNRLNRLKRLVPLHRSHALGASPAEGEWSGSSKEVELGLREVASQI